jgi:hypothetical protein
LDNVKISQEGLQFVTNLTATYAVNDRWGMEATGSWSFEQKDKLQTPRGGLVTESENTNSNLFIVSAGPRFLINDKLTIGLNYSLLYRDANEYDITNDRFIAAKTKHSAGLTLDYAITPTETISCRISHFWVDQDGGPLLPITVVNPGTAAEAVTSEYQPPELRYTGWAGGISGTIQF